MNVQNLIGVAALCVAILGGMGTAARAIWRMGSKAQGIVDAVTDNTKNTATLSRDLGDFSASTGRTLTDHGKRISRLEER